MTVGGPDAFQLVGTGEIALMVARHATLRGLCRELEDCANLLPDRYVMHRAVALSASLAGNLRECEAIGRMVWRRMFGASCEADDDRLVQRMRHYHSTDVLHAEDLCEALALTMAQGGGAGSMQTETLAYMMRCLFDGCRRCIDCRETVLLLMGRDRMSEGAAAALMASLQDA